MTTLLVRLALLEDQRGQYSAALRYGRDALEWSSKLGLAKELAQAEALMRRLEARPSQAAADEP